MQFSDDGFSVITVKKFRDRDAAEYPHDGGRASVTSVRYFVEEVIVESLLSDFRSGRDYTHD